MRGTGGGGRLPASSAPRPSPLACRKEKKPALARRTGFDGVADDGLLSHHLSVAVPSTLQGLTAVFGMGTGVAPAR